MSDPRTNHPVRANLPDGLDAPDGLLDAFWEYERALMANDLATLDRLFAPSPDTLRGDAGGLLIGHNTISAFRVGRGGAPRRTIERVEVRPISADAALIVAVTAPLTGGHGQQTQLWRRLGMGWAVSVAHVSLPAPAIAGAIWRVVGSPLVVGATEADNAESLTLAGHTVAVKDLFAVEGIPVGGGVPAFLAEQSPARATAQAVSSLLAAGASVQGIAQTDEFAYSIAGKNPHYGTPPNGAVTGAIPGGSSSGPASAVALGQASIGLGTDTGGSIRVPASYQGLWGLRTTHGAVNVQGLLPLAPTFDTVGWLTRDADTLRAAATASLAPGSQQAAPARYAIAPALSAQASPAVRAAFDRALADLGDAGLLDDIVAVDLGDIDALFEIFRTVQAAEAWDSHGDWVSEHPGVLGADIAARFTIAEGIDERTEAVARVEHSAARTRIERILDGRTLLLPSASSAAPSTTADTAEIEVIRASTLRMTCVAGLTGRPALSVPALDVNGAPVGLCVVGPRFTDLAVIGTGAAFAEALGR